MPHLFGDAGDAMSVPYVLKSMTQGVRLAGVLDLGAQPHVADHRLAARAGPRPARAVRRSGRRRDRHVLHRRLRARRWPSTTTMLAPVLSQPSLPFAGRQGAQARARALGRRPRRREGPRREREPVRARDALLRRTARYPTRAGRATARSSATTSSRSRSTRRRAIRTASRRARTRCSPSISSTSPAIPPRTRSTACSRSSASGSRP